MGFHYIWIMPDIKSFLVDHSRCRDCYGGVSSGVSWCYLQQCHSSLSSYPHYGALQQCSDCDGTSSRRWVILPIFSHIFQQYSWLRHWCYKWCWGQQPVFLAFIHPRAKWIPNSGKPWCIQLLHSKPWVHCHMALWEYIISKLCVDMFIAIKKEDIFGIRIPSRFKLTTQTVH